MLLIMKLLAKLSMGQRVVIVVALGAITFFLGEWITAVTTFTGWIAYAPLSGASSNVHHRDLTFGWVILIWIGLTIAWAVLSSIVLHRPKSE
jgi:heme/copper-type cytochrome/quinol oxidase subunit 1